MKEKVKFGHVWLEVVGYGGYSKVRKVKHTPSGSIRAVKIIYKDVLRRKTKNGLEQLYSEYELVRSLDHPNIVKYFDLQSTPDKLYLFMEYGGDSLAGLCESGQISLPDDRVAQLFGQIFGAIDYLAGQGIAHHDVKPQNILVDEAGRVRLADFQVAERHAGGQGCRCFYGTPAFQPPEIVSNTTGDPFDGEKADVWSAGVCLYQLACGGLPFVDDTVYLTMIAIERNPLAFPDSLDDLTKDLLQNLLTKDPKLRPRAEEALKHPWFASRMASVGCGDPASDFHQPQAASCFSFIRSLCLDS